MTDIEQAIYDTSLKARGSPTEENLSRWRHAVDDVSRGKVTPYRMHQSLIIEQLMEHLS